jgi:hypothetical protein
MTFKRRSELADKPREDFPIVMQCRLLPTHKDHWALHALWARSLMATIFCNSLRRAVAKMLACSTLLNREFTAIGAMVILMEAFAEYEKEVLRRLRGVYPRECPICGHRGAFEAFGHPPRYDARCPNCGSLERHRLLFLAITKENLLSRADRVLHFASERCIRAFLEPLVESYIAADITPAADSKILNIEDIALADGSINTVIANHVLEHVDDHRALREIWRILSCPGTLIASFPVVEGWDNTYENPSIADPELRYLHFGQADHLRYYGRDIRQRLEAVGYAVDKITCSGQDAVGYSLLRGERIFVCKKLDAKR